MTNKCEMLTLKSSGSGVKCGSALFGVYLEILKYVNACDENLIACHIRTRTLLYFSNFYPHTHTLAQADIDLLQCGGCCAEGH